MGAFGKWFNKLIDPSYPVKHAMAEIELAYGMLERAHQHMENGEAKEACTYLFGYAAACGIAKDDLKAVIYREMPKINGPAAIFPKESGQSDLDHWYDLCHRAIELLDEARVWIIERQDYYQGYLRLLIASDAVEQMLETPEPGPCRYCKEESKTHEDIWSESGQCIRCGFVGELEYDSDFKLYSCKNCGWVLEKKR